MIYTKETVEDLIEKEQDRWYRAIHKLLVDFTDKDVTDGYSPDLLDMTLGEIETALNIVREK